MISSSPKLMAVILPVAVDGIFATSLSVNTSHKSWYYKTIKVISARENEWNVQRNGEWPSVAYLFNFIANFNEELLDGGFFSAFTQIGQFDSHLDISAQEHLPVDGVCRGAAHYLLASVDSLCVPVKHFIEGLLSELNQ